VTPARRFRWPDAGRASTSKIALIVALAMWFSVSACERKKEPERTATAPGKKGFANYVLNFKPNDSPDLVPAKTLMLVQAPARERNRFCLDVNAKSFDQIAEVSFTLTFDPALMEYQSFQPGTLFEPKGNVAYQVAPVSDQKGKLRVKVSYKSGNTATGGTGKAVTFCFNAKDDGRGDILFENGQVLDTGKKLVGGVNWVGGLLWVLTG
jgi:cohesin domain-containing protein